MHVALAFPAERVRIAVALALAAAVEQEHAVAVTREQARLALRPLSARESDHGCTVLRRDVPTLELQPVARREHDFLVGGAEVGRRDEPARHMRQDVRDGQGEQNEVGGGERADEEQEPA